jgi:hypothetical protein
MVLVDHIVAKISRQGKPSRIWGEFLCQNREVWPVFPGFEKCSGILAGFGSPTLKEKGLFTHTVPAVCDGLAARIRALRSKDQGWQNVAEKNRTKGVARLRFFGARAAKGGEAYTDLLCAVCPYSILFLLLFTCYFEKNLYKLFWFFHIWRMSRIIK